MADDILGGEGHEFTAEGFTVMLGENVWSMVQQNPHFGAAMYVVVRDTEGGEKGGPGVFSTAVAKLANMTTEELQRVTKLEDVFRPPSRSL